MSRATILNAIREERERQITDEGWDEEHDEQHSDGELSAAAACYCYVSSLGSGTSKSIGDSRPGYVSIIDTMWPVAWGRCWFKPKGKRRNLVRAAALIVAELERMERK